MEELYDLQTDRHEMNNLIDHSTAADTLNELTTDLTPHLGETKHKP